MHCDVMFAGFGGQGILLSAKILAEAAMAEGREVAWIPSYGPEMRGGTAYCMVVVSDRPIGSRSSASQRSIASRKRGSVSKSPRVIPGHCVP